ncbi:MAG: DUF4364 family protein [Eubacteriales bacterium]|nr:DUF4364 family protein [Eubacteriales bacterium]
METPFTIYKLIVLFMLDNAQGPLTNSQISEYILDREYTNYFHLQQAISELVEAELIEMQTLPATSFYRLTEDGKNALSYFENEISPEIRQEAKDYLQEKGYGTQEQLLAPADYFPTPQGSYGVRCRLITKNVSLIDLSLSVPTLEAAKAICTNWPSKCEDFYGKLMEELL